MRTRIAALGMTIALIGLLAPTASAIEEVAATGESFLFTVEATGGSTAKVKKTGNGETFTLTLDGLAPVTMFSDRPFRDAALITPKALVTHWATWFASSAPNAVLTWSRPNQPPDSMVVVLTSPRLNGDELVFRATRLHEIHDPTRKGKQWTRPIAPTSLSSVSLYIDSVEYIINGPGLG
jgi:hypothetical protein